MSTERAARSAARLLDHPLSLGEVMERFPLLSSHGMGIYDGSTKSPGVRAAELAEERKKLRARAAHVDEVVALLRAEVQPVKTCKVGSYGLKHLVENSLNVYTTNGELIAAALMAGYPYKDDGVNLIFGMSLPDVRRFPGSRS